MATAKEVFSKTGSALIGEVWFSVADIDSDEVLLLDDSGEEAVVFKSGQEGSFCEDQDGLFVVQDRNGLEHMVHCFKLVELTKEDL